MSRSSVTVVLSVRNGAEFLARSIESVLAQDGVDLELLVYDNGSSDGSDAIAERYLGDPRVRLTRNPPGLRFPDSMNLGLERASGEFFVPWACDDEMLPGNLARKAEMLAAADAGLAFGGWLLDRGDGELRGVVLPAMGDEPRLLPAPSLFPLIATANAIAMPRPIRPAPTAAKRGSVAPSAPSLRVLASPRGGRRPRGGPSVAVAEAGPAG